MRMKYHQDRQDILHAIWQHRDIDALEFLVGIVRNSDSELIWQEAIDGILALRDKASLEIMDLPCPKKMHSINEAIELLETGII